MLQNVMSALKAIIALRATRNSSAPGAITAQQALGLTGRHAHGAHTVTHLDCTRKASVSHARQGNTVMVNTLPLQQVHHLGTPKLLYSTVHSSR